MHQRRIIHSRRRRDQIGTKSSKTPSDTLMVCGQVEIVTLRDAFISAPFAR